MSILLLVSQNWLNTWKGVLLFRTPPIHTFKTLQLSVLKCNHSSLLPHTAGPEHRPTDGLDSGAYSSAGWVPKNDKLGFSPHYYERDSRCCPTQICMSCLPSVLQSLANHTTNSHIWMLFHLVLPTVTVITFQGSLAGKVKWHDMKRVRLKQVFNSKCRIHKDILWTGTKWDCHSLSYS